MIVLLSNSGVEDIVICVWDFFGYFTSGGLSMHHSPYAHTLCISWVWPYTWVWG